MRFGGRHVPALLVLFALARPFAAAGSDGPPVLALTAATAAPSLADDTGWERAAHLATGWDFTDGRAASQPAAVAVVLDAANLYARFTVRQRAGVTATQAVDGVGENADDDVVVRLWPDGTSGFSYYFRATPHGTRYQGSSENNIYAPNWIARAHPTSDGYVVTMVIPLRALRGGGAHAWRAQFERFIKAENERDVWAHAPGQTTTDQVAYAGTLDGVIAQQATRPKPRVAVYGLAQAGPPAYGGDGLRFGADLALPVTPTASLVATFHPNFSNVESDQQTIAPTTFTRFYPELRPFFAQGAKFYDYTSCYACLTTWQELYTTAIPTPRSGYQLEGTQGRFTFGALDAVGYERNDNAQSLAWSSSGNIVTGNYTRVASEQPGLRDLVNFGSLQYNSQHGITGYVQAASETGTPVADARYSQRWDGGIAYNTKDDQDSFAMRSVGPQWNPVDGFTPVNDIAGWATSVRHAFQLKGGPVRSISVLAQRDYYQGSDGFGNNLQDFQQQLVVSFADQLTLQVFTGSQFYRVPGEPILYPDNSQGARIDYLFNTPQDSTLSVLAGSYGTGWLTATDRVAAFRIARRMTLALEAYDTRWTAGSAVEQQWLERATATFDVDRNTNAVLGLRRIVGTPPPFPGLAVPAFVNTTNVSFGFTRHLPHDDIFVAYGNPDAPFTQNQFIAKFVHYFGAERGT